MKIRIKGNSIRLRLSRPEVEYFGQENYLEDAVNFGNSKLVYALSGRGQGSVITAEFENNKITVNIPSALAVAWTKTEKVGYDAEHSLSDGRRLYILVEKDFKCLDNTVEDQSANYPNPLAER